ncbi:metallophosphoesterase [Senegalia massiliensis]|uniref:Calcineurin-like phosphoesterase domain-containing protein n=1 Tax=Senegalia massiliensis TaxID=1720316 RepID=A0A845R531_9CLOT|nr:metallophosphoesterase [Senegalia massiliensis]NBI07613.1 hypothetical protein [Senegalia massiliensis]
MSFKFSLVGDMHQRKNAPANRLDDFYLTLKNKIREIVDVSYSNNVDAIIQTGDFFDNPMPSMAVTNEVIKLWLNGVDISDVIYQPYKEFTKMSAYQREYEELTNEIINIYDESNQQNNPESKEKRLYKDIELLIKDKKKQKNIITSDINNIKPKLEKKIKKVIPILLVGGNHELYGNSINTLNRTMLGFLVNLGILKLVSKKNPHLIKKNNLTCAITGTSYHNDIDSRGYESDYIIDKKLGDRHIHLIHGMLHNKDMGKIIRHTTIDQITDTLADFTYTGHEHNGFPLTQVDGKYFYNSGAIPRLNISEIERKPKIGILNMTKGDISLEEHYLKSARNGKDVLDISKKLKDKHKEEEFAEYRKAVRNVGKIEGYNVMEIINSISSNKNIKPKVRDKALEMVSNAIQKLENNQER